MTVFAEWGMEATRNGVRTRRSGRCTAMKHMPETDRFSAPQSNTRTPAGGSTAILAGPMSRNTSGDLLERRITKKFSSLQLFLVPF